MRELYECIIVGGGFAGLQASIQLGRYKRNTLVIDSNYGRSTLCKNYRNILGWPEGISGLKLRELGKVQALEYKIKFLEDKVVGIQKNDDSFLIITKNGLSVESKTVLLATGLMDRIPEINNLVDCLGSTIYVCPDCDGYEIENKNVLLLGAGSVGANLALELTYWTNQITYINHDGDHLEDEIMSKLTQNNIGYKKEAIKEVIKEGSSTFKGIQLENGQILHADRAFIGFGGNKVHNELASQLGVALLNQKHVIVDPRTKETNIQNVWAAGDLVAHSQQVTISIGEGTQAAVWIHKRLRELDSKL